MDEKNSKMHKSGFAKKQEAKKRKLKEAGEQPGQKKISFGPSFPPTVLAPRPTSPAADHTPAPLAADHLLQMILLKTNLQILL
ncbi:Uncharacterised protein r2_g506 [Pycnogonum litorale]